MAGGREEWILANPDDDPAREVRASLDMRLRQYFAYRGVLSFCYVVLAR